MPRVFTSLLFLFSIQFQYKYKDEKVVERGGIENGESNNVRHDRDVTINIIVS